jgi:hypothetical protein
MSTILTDIIMLTKPEDFVTDYVSKERASKIANELFMKWAQEQGVCLHPLEKVKPVKLAWDVQGVDLKCECGKLLKITEVRPVSSTTP